MKWQRHAQWSDRAEQGLADTLRHDRDVIAAGVNRGAFELWEIEGKAWMVTRTEASVLTVCCLRGAGLRSIAPIVYQIAQVNGVHAIEFYTNRPALARLLRPLRFIAQETVYRCEVTRGQ